jgi:hypothetical protein
MSAVGGAIASALAPYFAQMAGAMGKGGAPVYLDGVQVGRQLSQQTRRGNLRVHPAALGGAF